jgi:D-amino-acid dehydrogenase
MKCAVIIGGGIIGLSSAYYLQKSGWKVTVLDKGDFLDNCSYGNAGYVCPSHFVPLATPGIVKQGLKWMMNARSPFYVQPRLNRDLFDWGRKFMASAKADRVEKAAIPLRDIALLSHGEYDNWEKSGGLSFNFAHKGLLEIFQTAEKAHHAEHLVSKSLELGLEARLLNKKELQDLEPQTRIEAIGAVYFKCDSHLFPNKLMEVLGSYLRSRGVEFIDRTPVDRFEINKQILKRVIAGDSVFEADEFVLAAGAWTNTLAASLDVRIPLVAGRGYSITLVDSPYKLNHPAILAEGRVALTPMDDRTIRFGGTMEITSIGQKPRYERVQGILDSVKKFFPDFNVPLPTADKIWFGYRPCSADGLPYIGRVSRYNNLIIATGHAMLGLSLGAGTGKLVGELINGNNPSMDISPFAVERFGS